jgi:hypothetical protein
MDHEAQNDQAILRVACFVQHCQLEQEWVFLLSNLANASFLELQTRLQLQPQWMTESKG